MFARTAYLPTLLRRSSCWWSKTKTTIDHSRVQKLSLSKWGLVQKLSYFYVKMSYLQENKSHFHINNFALNFALKRRLWATRKWPICKKSKFAEDQGKREKTHCPLCSFPLSQPPTGSTKRLLGRREVWCSFSWKEKHGPL